MTVTVTESLLVAAVRSKMDCLSGISSVSNSSFNSYGSSDTILTEPLVMNSSVFLNNSIVYGSR